MTAVELSTKRCTKCDTELPLTGFYRHQGTKDGRHSWCKTCIKQSVAAYQDRMRKELGETEWRRRKLQSVKRHRETEKGKRAMRLQAKAWQMAEAALREAHRAEFDALYRQARYDLGLPIENES